MHICKQQVDSALVISCLLWILLCEKVKSTFGKAFETETTCSHL